MALVLVIFLKVFFLLVTEGSLVNNSISYNISLGSYLTTLTNPSWLSPSGLFAFGFYQQDDGFAVGIWLTTKPEITVVWTANRDDPPLLLNSTVEFTRDGWLVLVTTYGEHKSIIDQSDPATSASMFDSVSSVSASQYSSGRFVLKMQDDGNLVAYPQNSSMWDSDAYWSSGTLSGFYESLVLNRDGSLYIKGYADVQKVLNPSTSSRLKKNETIVFRATLSPQGNFLLYSHRFTNLSSNSTRVMEWEALQDPCKAKGICGVNSYCSTTAREAECHCFPGFSFFTNSSNGKFLGCYRNFTDEEACSRRGLQLSYKITALDNMEVGAYPYSDMNLSKEACINSCLDDCNCWVGLYTNGSCKMLKVPVIYAELDKSKLATVFIKTSFPKVKDQQHEPPAPLEIPEQNAVAERKKLVSILAITLGFFALMCTLMAFSSFFYYRVHARRYQRMSENVDFGLLSDHFTLRSFSFEELHKATDGFKEVIGRNSIGEVYKGFISEGTKAVAVKRLHTRMLEGDKRFQAEITAIAQTHHRNLVRLLGFCIHGATKLLVYEFMSNGSLADLLSNPETQPGWQERASLALDVARGILYLHQECETRIIHCNIKPHNILFDESWTAKISDFGLSKLLRPDQSGTLTGVRGTTGYLAPEWHKNNLISTKVDIYSFGVVFLEILCCTGDMEIEISRDDKMSLFTWVYNCFEAKELKRLVGDEEVDMYMLEKMVKVGLLCVQDDPEARPLIKDVILMLEGTTDIPTPPSPILSLM
ncbi:hypothetical protein L1987_05175 [Smallanthus sonchifolius]|uniref:Uncharacterized protein n=1 Tax=Smallanthus sonchifolius TaxID=185202 RepID=A0ACB9JUL9_9ASTR|nr:hypothetical protein L1987_05175 [Smallanthus sonchifolius]